MIKRVQNNLFYLLVFLLPLNLGKHFIVSESYVKSYLVDYLIPTVWATDLLVFVLLVLWLVTGGVRKISKFPHLGVILVFLTVLLPSVALAPRIVPSIYVYLSFLLHVLFMLFVASNVDPERVFGRMVAIMSVSVLLLSVLAFFQWKNQGSVFDNYLFFGEQPYSLSTDNIALVNFFGFLKVPAYGTFRHPNILGGFLAIVVFWGYALLLLGSKSNLLKFSFVFGFLALFLTFSETAILAMFLGMIFLVSIRKFGKRGVIASLFVTFAIFFFSLFLPVLSKVGWFQEEPSIYRRSNLQKSAYMMLEDTPSFGVGLGNFTVKVEEYLPRSQVLRFMQPVHNIFVLIFAESGIFALMVLFIVLLAAMATLLDRAFGIPAIIFVSILQFFILGSFDHYLLTIQQMQLLFWLTVGLALAYTKGDVEVQN